MRKKETIDASAKIVRFSDGTARLYVFVGEDRAKYDFIGDPAYSVLSKKSGLPESAIREAWKSAK